MHSHATLKVLFSLQHFLYNYTIRWVQCIWCFSVVFQLILLVNIFTEVNWTFLRSIDLDISCVGIYRSVTMILNLMVFFRLLNYYCSQQVICPFSLFTVFLIYGLLLLPSLYLEDIPNYMWNCLATWDVILRSISLR